jgi:hypothetical protein
MFEHTKPDLVVHVGDLTLDGMLDASGAGQQPRGRNSQ